MKSKIQEQLHQLALKHSTPFCYSCCKEAPSGCCETCGSDDLARLASGVGCDWSTDWIIEHILKTELTAVNIEDVFEQTVRECFPEETTVGWLTFDTVTLLKQNDPVSWHCAVSEFAFEEKSEGNILSLDGGSNYYWMSDVEALVQNE